MDGLRREEGACDVTFFRGILQRRLGLDRKLGEVSPYRIGEKSLFGPARRFRGFAHGSPNLLGNADIKLKSVTNRFGERPVTFPRSFFESAFKVYAKLHGSLNAIARHFQSIVCFAASTTTYSVQSNYAIRQCNWMIFHRIYLLDFNLSEVSSDKEKPGHRWNGSGHSHRNIGESR